MKRTQIRALFVQYGPMVHRRAYAILGNRNDAEEAAQEVFIRVMKKIEAFESRASLSTWLYRITTNYCFNVIRDRRRRRELWDQHQGETYEQARPGGPEPAKLVLLRQLLAEADEQLAAAAIYVHVDGMSHNEAARVMGVSRRTVGNLIERFQKWAQEHVADGDDPDGTEQTEERP